MRFENKFLIRILQFTFYFHCRQHSIHIEFTFLVFNNIKQMIILGKDMIQDKNWFVTTAGELKHVYCEINKKCSF